MHILANNGRLTAVGASAAGLKRPAQSPSFADREEAATKIPAS
jgi:hypothetical protein